MEFDEMTALNEIKEGKKLSEFKREDYHWDEGKEPKLFPTRLMVLAALTYHGKDAAHEIPEDAWTERAAGMAVKTDYKAFDILPDEMKIKVIPAFVQASAAIKRSELDDYMSLVNRQSEEFIKKAVNMSSAMRKFVLPEKLSPHDVKKPVVVKGKAAVREDTMSAKKLDFLLDFSEAEDLSSPDEITAERFLSLPVEKKSQKYLEQLIRQKEDLPEDFIKRLTIPNRNAAYYMKAGDTEQANKWKERVIPFLNLDLCRKIAIAHPEASIKTPSYLDPASVRAFWNRKKAVSTKTEMTEWFLKFPEKVLNPDMREDMAITLDALNHAPSVFVGTPEARKYIGRHPADILRLPEYQTPGWILVAAVPLNRNTLQYIKDEKFRELVGTALNIKTA